MLAFTQSYRPHLSSALQLEWKASTPDRGASKPGAWCPSPAQVPGNVNHGGPLIAFEQQQRLQDGRAIIVEQTVIPTVLDQLRYQHRGIPAGMVRLQLEDVVHDRPDH